MQSVAHWMWYNKHTSENTKKNYEKDNRFNYLLIRTSFFSSIFNLFSICITRSDEEESDSIR